MQCYRVTLDGVSEFHKLYIDEGFTISPDFVVRDGGAGFDSSAVEICCAPFFSLVVERDVVIA